MGRVLWLLLSLCAWCASVSPSPPGTATSMCVRSLHTSVAHDDVLRTDTEGTTGSGDCSDGDIMLTGTFINIGINRYAGTFGSLYGVPQNKGGGKSWGENIAGGYPFPPNVNHTLAIEWGGPSLRGLGFIADWDKNGWGPDERGPTDPAPHRLQPGYSGDFFMPGEPYEGYVIQYTTAAGDTPAFINLPLMNMSSAYGGPNYYTAHMESFTLTSSDERASALWVGSVGDLKVTILTTLQADGLYYTYTTSIKNVGDETLTDLTFLRTIDPDNEYDYVRMLHNATVEPDGLIYDSGSQDDSIRGHHHFHWNPPFNGSDDTYIVNHHQSANDDHDDKVYHRRYHQKQHISDDQPAPSIPGIMQNPTNYQMWPFFTNNYVKYQPDGSSKYAGPVPNAALVCACGDVMMDFLMCMGSVHPVAWVSHESTGVRDSRLPPHPFSRNSFSIAQQRSNVSRPHIPSTRLRSGH